METTWLWQDAWRTWGNKFREGCVKKNRYQKRTFPHHFALLFWMINNIVLVLRKYNAESILKNTGGAGPPHHVTTDGPPASFPVVSATTHPHDIQKYFPGKFLRDHFCLRKKYQWQLRSDGEWEIFGRFKLENHWSETITSKPPEFLFFNIFGPLGRKHYTHVRESNFFVDPQGGYRSEHRLSSARGFFYKHTLKKSRNENSNGKRIV